MFHKLKFYVLSLVVCSFLLNVAAFGQTSPPGVRRKRTFYQNPTFNSDFPDPTVIRAEDGYYYAYATQTFVNDVSYNIQVARSPDLVNWQRIGEALPVKPVWANQTQNFWAPHVIRADGKYIMYYSADPNQRTGLCLAVATATSPAGPFTDKGAPLRCGQGFVNIDPMAFDDPQTGKRLLYWGSGFEPIRVQELAADRINFLPNSQPINLVFPISGVTPTNYRNLVEGAWVTYRNDYYYLFFSGDDCCNANPHYAIMLARSRSATGPFEIFPGNAVILEANSLWIGPGHNSVIRDDKSIDYLVYHAFDRNDRNKGRVMLMNRLIYRDGWLRAEDGSPTREFRAAPTVKNQRP